MELDEAEQSTIMGLQVDQSGEACMVDQERWAEIRRLFHEEQVSISEIGRRCQRSTEIPPSAII